MRPTRKTTAGIVQPLQPHKPSATLPRRSPCPKCGEFMNQAELKAHVPHCQPTHPQSR